jgi:heat shock protein HtpX
MKRILLFIATNLLVVLTISILINLLGVRPGLYRRGIDYQSLLIFCAIWGFAGSFISLQLSRWSAKMSLGVQLIDPANPGHPEAMKLVEVVSRLSRAANLPNIPEIGVYPSREVNAFATGPSASRSLLAVSAGLLERMDDRAIEGVLGHEISHIANGDMVTMTLIQGVVNTFVMFFSRIAVFALENALRSRDDREGPHMGYFMRMMLTSLFETVLMLLASPLVYWFSRTREFRADLGSARIAGRDRMIHALESLRGTERLADPRAAGAVAAFKINGTQQTLLAKLFASHPTIDQRIAALQTAAI